MLGGTNELGELYDVLSVLYAALPAESHDDWGEALSSVLYGGDYLAQGATCYGKQQNDRNRGKRKEYVRRYGDGSRITEFTSIAVDSPRPRDESYLPEGAVLPVAPRSRVVLPVRVTDATRDAALALLSEFPAEPAGDTPGNGQRMLLRPDLTPGQSVRDPTDATERTLLFVSDTHVGFENRPKTERGRTVDWMDEIDTLDAVEQVAALATDLNVDAVVHAGDVLDHEIDRERVHLLGIRLNSLVAAGIPVYCIVGSHDHGSADPRHAESVNGVAYLRQWAAEGVLSELTTTPTRLPESEISLFGVSAENVGLTAIGSYRSRGWSPADVSFEEPETGTNVLCLHDSTTPYRSRSRADVDLDNLLASTDVPFDCVLVGDEHRPFGRDFDGGYEFVTANGTPVYYTGPAERIGSAYENHHPLVTEVTIGREGTSVTRHALDRPR